MLAIIAEAVNIRQSVHEAMDNLLTDRMLSQIAAEVENAGDMGATIPYKGPMDFAPEEVPITNPMGPVNNADGTYNKSNGMTMMAQVSSTQDGDG
jgi:hypothetical protein